MKTINIYRNYGVLAAEKRYVYTYGAEHAHATVSDELTVELPDGWETAENYIGELLLVAPWGATYGPNDILEGNENPLFIVYDENGKERRFKLKVIE